ncbi:MAG: aromatic ring-hydroxylating dioxygenase subunit alpha [Pseudorhodoplanes sp.]
METLTELKHTLRAAGQADPASALSMPAAFYTSPEVLKLEEDRIFRAEWICLGRIDDVPNPGDYFTAQLLNEPLLVIRGDDSKIRVLSNVCRHRGMTLASGCGSIKRRIVCPYHSWSYSADGKLVNAPRMEDVKGFDIATKRLPEFASEIWRGFIYVNLDGKAAPLAPRLAGLEPYIDKYHMEEMNKYNGGETTWQTNWKCLIENFTEGYHIAFTHPKSINPILPMQRNEKIPGGTGYTGYRANQTPNLPLRGAFPPDATEIELRSSMIFCIYPSQLVALSNTATSISVRPLGVDSVELHWDKMSYAKSLTAEQQATAMAYFDTYMNEDREMVESVQRGNHSHHMERCELGPENLIAGVVSDFYRYLSQRLL